MRFVTGWPMKEGWMVGIRERGREVVTIEASPLKRC